MSDKSYYEILNIDKNTSTPEIKKAYKKMAMKYHPDRNQGDDDAEEKFKEVNEAYQVLSDDEKRGIYDRFGKEGLNGQGFSGQNMDMSDVFGDIFGDFFGGGGRGQRRSQERQPYELDAITRVQLDFKEAIFGCKRTIDYSYKLPCEGCNATGAKNGEFSSCSTCNGQGQVFMKQAFMTIQQTCPTCRGVGKSAKTICQSCRGNSYTMAEDTINVDIPEGVDDGMKIRVPNKGNKYKNQRGDLYLQVQAKKDDNFIRDEHNIYLQVPVFFTDILLEKKIKVPSIRGELELRLHRNMRDKEHCIFKREGVKDVSSNAKGDFIVQVDINYPKKINNDQKELLENLAYSFENERNNHKNILSSILQKAKSWIG